MAFVEHKIQISQQIGRRLLFALLTEKGAWKRRKRPYYCPVKLSVRFVKCFISLWTSLRLPPITAMPIML